MNKLNSSQVEKLIELIKEKPFMYNKSEDYYKCLDLKERVWEQISKEVGADDKYCRLAWKSLRDQFVKAYREISTKPVQEDTRKTYKHYDQLLFLQDSLTLRDKRTCTDETWLESEVSAILNTPKIKRITIDDVHERDPFEISMLKNEEGSQASSFSSAPSIKSNVNANNNNDNLKDSLHDLIKELRNPISQPQNENDLLFSTMAVMINKANLTPFQTRQIHRKLFNLVSDELDNIERSNK